MHAWWSELRSRALLRRSEPAPGTVEVLHAVAGGSSSGPWNSGRFFLGVREGRTPRKNLPAVSRAHSDPVRLTEGRSAMFALGRQKSTSESNPGIRTSHFDWHQSFGPSGGNLNANTPKTCADLRSSSNTRWGVSSVNQCNQSTVMMSQYAERSAGGIGL